MPRVFGCLAFANILLLTASGALGLFAGHWTVERHVLLAVLTLLFSCFVQVVTFTYLTVTGKMAGQAVHLAKMDASILFTIKRFKRGMTRCLAAVFLSIVFVTASGASGWRTGGVSLWHDVAAGIAFVVHAVVLWFEFEIVVANAHLVESTMIGYQKARAIKRVVQG